MNLAVVSHWATAIIEAMVAGLPCIGSRVGGIPELLENDDMVPRAITRLGRERYRCLQRAGTHGGDVAS